MNSISNSKFTQIKINNKSNFIFNYYKTKSKNVFIVKNDIWKLNIQWKDFHCKYDFTLQLNPLVPTIQIWFNPKTCKVEIWNNLQQLVLKDNSKVYEQTNKQIEISNFSGFFYIWIFVFMFLITTLLMTKLFVMKNNFINYKG